jgi:hypothetical protein
MRLHTALLAFALLAPTSCAVFGPQKEHVRTEAALGKVIIYRNGVAYFERHASVQGDQLTLTVPAGRVDDFLKSLTVIDAKSGATLPVSFPTVEPGTSTVELQVHLPTKKHHDLRLSYVTESPSWKPTYRVLLEEAGKGRLMAWAVVDNTSGEDWERVTIGVGSTSALSFRYDLRSVRMVQRETLGDDNRMALAPPTGGSPYEVEGQQVRLLGNIRNDEVDHLAQIQTATRDMDEKRKDGKAVPVQTQATYGTSARGRRSAEPVAAGGLAVSSNVDRLAVQLRGTNERIRIEGFAQKGDADPRVASLERANVIREQLIANGVPPAQVEAIGTGTVNDREGARILAENVEAPPPAVVAPPSDAPNADDPIGNALFVTDSAMSIPDGRSAMVSLVNEACEAKQVYYYDPVSPRGSQRFAFKAVRVVNPSAYTLDGGPFTVYAKGQFLGEGLSEPIPPRSEAFIPFGLDREVIVEPVITSREEIHQLVTMQRGIVSTETRSIRRTELQVTNRGQHPAEVYVRHAVPHGWSLSDSVPNHRKLGGAYLFPVTVAPKASVRLGIEAWTPIMKTIDLRTDAGVKAIGLYLSTNKALEPDMREKLAQIVKMHGEIHDTQERVQTLASQMQVYRQRIDEIHVQLVTLRKVPTAQKLSQHLAKKMEEISQKLQELTVETTDLEGQLMTKRITIQDRIAELTLARKGEGNR